MQNDFLQFAGYLKIGSRNRLWFFINNRNEQMIDRFAIKRQPARQKLIQNDTETKYVGSVIYSFPACLFGRHISRRSHHAARPCLEVCAGFRRFGSPAIRRQLFDYLCQPEIKHFDVTVGTNHYIFRLNITMNNSGGVSGLESGGDLNNDFQRVGNLDSARAHCFPQGLALDKLRREKMNALIIAEFKNSQNIRMIQSGSGVCLAFKAQQSFGISGNFFGQNFKRNPAAQTAVFRQIDFAHSARANLLNDAVMRKIRVG